MFKNTYQSGILSLFYSCGSKPLSLWSKTVKSGYVKRLTDEQIQSLVLEIVGSNVVSTYISCPSDPTATLGIRLPILVMLVKNLKKYFSFEIQIKDTNKIRRIMKFCTHLKVTIVPFDHISGCTLQLNLAEGWNRITINLLLWCEKALGCKYKETEALRIHSSCRLLRVFFTETEMKDSNMPPEYTIHQY